MLKSPLLWKIVTLGGAMILLLISLMLIRQILMERADYCSDVEAAIRQSTSGPLVAIPVTELYTVLEENKAVRHKRSYLYFWLPESLLVEGNQNVEARKISIYQGQVWNTDVAIKAEFDVARLHELDKPTITL
ncbi:hypothetical protein ZH77_002159 [Salmonella enterica subsp. salamae]|uniref:Inner membrane protein n=1 Tax=Salmonella enterica subsp. salamae TaxID=59202 RepID=A0A5Y1WA10_SALER|nr:hypothetical protein [Salmonella enterica]ECC1604810.1 hypothetical protein [Salmonella enterica subsp. salamae]HAE4722578.1 hypothetical protein [Salmonella enterica subsp. salamae serovar 47:a:1,5]EAY7464332.1 hypothetical protein [Salmonella enterica]EBN6685554.1 hypothetical protein [Salmonella enterica]